MDGEQDDATLVAAARANPEAFTALYQRYVRPIYRFCYVRLGTPQQAEDATSRAFVKALTGLSGFRGGAFAVWLFRIAGNVIHDMQRRQRPMQQLDVESDCVAPLRGLEDEVVARAERAALCAALARLPAAQRTAVELRLAGWSDPHIAQMLGKTQAAVRMLRHRALHRLRASLRHNEGQDGEGGT